MKAHPKSPTTKNRNTAPLAVSHGVIGWTDIPRSMRSAMVSFFAIGAEFYCFSAPAPLHSVVSSEGGALSPA